MVGDDAARLVRWMGEVAAVAVRDGGAARRLQPVDRSGSVEREKWRWKWNGGEVQL